MCIGYVIAEPASAAISGTQVQSAYEEGGGSQTLDGTGDDWAQPSAGNQIVCGAMVRPDAGENYNVTPPTGFTTVFEYFPASSFNGQGGLYCKTAAGSGEDSLTFTIPNTPSSWAVACWEFASTDLLSNACENAEDSDEDEGSVSGTPTSVGPLSLTNTTPDSLMIVMNGVYNGTLWGTNTYSDSFVDQDSGQPTGGPAKVYLGTRVVSSAAALAPSATAGGSGTPSYMAGIVLPGVGDSNPPVYTVPPAVSTKTSTSVTFAATATDDSGPIDHYFAVYADGTQPTAANVKAGNGTGFVTSTADSDLNVTSGNAASVTSGANLTANTAYEGCMVAEDNAGNLQSSATCVGFTTLPSVDGIPILVEDSFTDADDTSIESHTPDTDEAGDGWSIEDVWSGQAAGTATIQSNGLELQEQTGAIINVGTTNMVVDADYVAGSGELAGIVLRYVDSQNWFKCQYLPSSNQIQLQKRVADVTTNFGNQSFGFTASQTYRITGWVNGNNIGCAIDGVPKVAITDSALNTSTKGGVFADGNSTVANFDDLTVLQSFNAVNPNTGEVPDDPKGFFLGQTRQSGDIYWVDPDDLPDQDSNTLLFYYGGSFYIDPETDLAGDTQWGLELYDSVANTITTSSHTHTTGGATECVEGVGPVAASIARPVAQSLQCAY